LEQIQQAWKKLLRRNQADAQPSNDDVIPSAVVEGIQSPYAAGRSVVMIALRDDDAEEEFTTAFLDRSQSSDVAHSISLLRGGHFASYDVESSYYHVGDISRYTLMRIWMTEYFWGLLLTLACFSWILASWTRDYLVRRAAIRLEVVHA
jgi:cellulose synthase (UDP-forming)